MRFLFLFYDTICFVHTMMGHVGMYMYSGKTASE